MKKILANLVLGGALLFATHSGAETLDPIWSGTAGMAQNPTSVRVYPGQRVRGEVLGENERHYARTGRLVADYIASVNDAEFRLPAGTIMIANPPPIPTRMQMGPDQMAPPPAHRPADNSIQWCALPEAGGFVCFYWDVGGGVRFAPAFAGGELPSSRAPFGPSYSGPAPEISEQTVGLPALVRRLSLEDFDRAGFTVRTTLSEGEGSTSFVSQRMAWDQAHRTWLAPDHTFQATPVTNSNGDLVGASFAFSGMSE